MSTIHSSGFAKQRNELVIIIKRLFRRLSAEEEVDLRRVTDLHSAELDIPYSSVGDAIRRLSKYHTVYTETPNVSARVNGRLTIEDNSVESRASRLNDLWNSTIKARICDDSGITAVTHDSNMNSQGTSESNVLHKTSAEVTPQLLDAAFPSKAFRSKGYDRTFGITPPSAQPLSSTEEAELGAKINAALGDRFSQSPALFSAASLNLLLMHQKDPSRRVAPPQMMPQQQMQAGDFQQGGLTHMGAQSLMGQPRAA